METDCQREDGRRLYRVLAFDFDDDVDENVVKAKAERKKNEGSKTARPAAVCVTRLIPTSCFLARD